MLVSDSLAFFPVAGRCEAALRLQIVLRDNAALRIDEMHEDSVIASGLGQRAPVQFEAQRATRSQRW